MVAVVATAWPDSHRQRWRNGRYNFFSANAFSSLFTLYLLNITIYRTLRVGHDRSTKYTLYVYHKSTPHPVIIAVGHPPCRTKCTVFDSISSLLRIINYINQVNTSIAVKLTMAWDREGADLPRALLRTLIRFVSDTAAVASVDPPLDGMVSEWWWWWC